MLSKAIDATFENIAILRGLIQEGKLRALGAQNKIRTPLLPDMPTMAEAGVPDCEANTFFGLVAPAGTPPDIIKKISDAMNDGLATAEMQKIDHRPRQRGKAQFSGGVRRLHRRAEQEMG